MVHPVILTNQHGVLRYPMELIVDLRVEANN